MRDDGAGPSGRAPVSPDASAPPGLLRRAARSAGAVVDALAADDRAWSLIDRTLLRLDRRLLWSRGQVESRRADERTARLARRLSASLEVLHGPFAGLRYPEAAATGSSLLPKVLGTYEQEIHPWIEHIAGGGHRIVVNVGCAEGYYAVGLARRLPAAEVLAYDSDPRARELCRAMAEANGVAERVTVGATCTEDDLVALGPGSAVLVVMDCEGCERSLLSRRVVDALPEADFLVELHDFIDITTSGTIDERFAASHDIEQRLSEDDIRKAYTYEVPDLDELGLSLEERRVTLAEGRPTIMRWILATHRLADDTSA